MQAQNNPNEDDSFETGVYHDDEEVCIRARSQHSNAKHYPKTDDGGAIVYEDADGNRADADHDDAEPIPTCEITPKTETEYILMPVDSCVNRDPCGRCERKMEADTEDGHEEAQENGGAVSWARKMRFGDDWGSAGDESSSGNTSQSVSD